MATRTQDRGSDIPLYQLEVILADSAWANDVVIHVHTSHFYLFMFAVNVNDQSVCCCLAGCEKQPKPSLETIPNPTPVTVWR